MKKTTRKFWIPIAACLAVMAVIGMLAAPKTETYTLESGKTLIFAESRTLAAPLDLDVTVRAMTDAETRQLFAGLPVSANAYFDPGSGEPIGLEGRIGEVKFLICAPGANLLDAVVAGSEYTSTVGGHPVAAGYFITEAKKTVIYYASFTLGGNTYYVEFAGDVRAREEVKSALADAILTLIGNGELDLHAIHR